ncbi:hypothetical protein [Microbispora triticiradicis]|uniref:Secreted protein n=2 Tax=Microbispora TaxID=2005 RepID=A0ABY3LVB2_9ACTN|nr:MULTISPECIES: hypothetical protein [Microbispora]TLP60535.1 hypothetical protein FED44_11460 [Microbispora fusca]TYB54823.1 hypothetical protein FXF59_21850 [Microbispora tritici]
MARTRIIAVATTAGLLAALAGLTAPAQAGTGAASGVNAATARAASTSGSCSNKGAFINFNAYYHNSSRYHVFTSFDWSIGGSGVRNKNNVELRVKHHNTAGHDTIHWTWISLDNTRKGYSKLTSANAYRPVPKSGVKVAKNKKAYVEFKAVFDKKGTDPRCGSHTQNI